MFQSWTFSPCDSTSTNQNNEQILLYGTISRKYGLLGDNKRAITLSGSSNIYSQISLYEPLKTHDQPPNDKPP